MIATPGLPTVHVLLGAGGHAKVVLATARAVGLTLRGVCDPTLSSQGVAMWRDMPVLGDDSALDAVGAGELSLLNGVGQLVGGSARAVLYARMRQRGFRFPPLVHPSAWVDPTARLGEGVQIMAGAVVQADCRIDENSIVNTGARIDHDCTVGAHVHIAPGAILCGEVQVGDSAFVGAGSVALQGRRMGSGSVLGANTVLRRDLGGDTLRQEGRLDAAVRSPRNLRKDPL